MTCINVYMKKEVIQFRLEGADYEAVKTKADELGLSVSAYVRMILKKNLTHKKNDESKSE